jgi:hypothetical protein
MSIEIISHRQDSYCRDDVHLSTIKASVGRAVISAVRYELGYGGSLQIKEDHLATRSLTIVTPVINKVDTVTFTADTDEEYLALVTAVAMYMAIKMQLNDDVMLKRHFPNMDTEGMRAFDVCHTYPVMAGLDRTRVTYIGLLVDAMDEMEMATRLMNHNIDDLEALLQLKYEGASPADLIALAA